MFLENMPQGNKKNVNQCAYSSNYFSEYGEKIHN